MVALNTAYAAPKNAADPKNRVGDFFYEDRASVGQNRWAKRLNTQEKSSYHYETASGRSNWPNRDPIEEWGGINLYEMVQNNPVDYWDYLGNCAAVLLHPGTWVVISETVVSVLTVAGQVITTILIVEEAIDTYQNYKEECGKCVEDGQSDQTRNKSYTKTDSTKSTQSKPTNAPPGTIPIDQAGLGKDDLHDIKDGVGAGNQDWTGIAPNGDVITTNPDGTAENHGPYQDYLP